MKEAVQITVSLFVLLNTALQHVCKLLLMQKIRRQISTLRGIKLLFQEM